MSLKHAVLALVAERRGYGYELVQRFEERVGPGWQLNPSAVYPALDQLERGGLVTSTAAPRRHAPQPAHRLRRRRRPAKRRWRRGCARPTRRRSRCARTLHLRLAFAPARAPRRARRRSSPRTSEACARAARALPARARPSRAGQRSSTTRSSRGCVRSWPGSRTRARRSSASRADAQPAAAGTGTPARSAMRAASAATVGQAIPWRAPARRTAPGDRVELGLAAGGDVALHRGAEAVVEHFELAEHDRRVDLGALRPRDGGALAARTPPARPSAPGRSGSRRTTRRRRPSCTRAC